MTWRSILSVIGGAGVFVIVGSMYLFGVMAPYLLAYYNKGVKEQDKVQLKDLMLFMPIRCVTLIIALPLGSYCFNKGVSVRM